MPVNFFPPPPSYPIAIDSDYTLFLVCNTTEARLSEHNEGWSDEVSIVPVMPDAPEIWPANGFATIKGEMFYYDAVGLDANGKVNLLRRCARNLSGSSTQFNPKGTYVRGFVVAEHHNQMIQAVSRVEDFIGINYDTRVATLDYRIRNLISTPVIFDDWGCPDVSFSYITLQDDPAGGVLISYTLQIEGDYASFSIDFGDGTQTTTDQTGTHRYAFNASINPVVTVTGNNCTQVQSPIQYTDPSTPALPTSSLTYSPIIPEIPTFPTISVPSVASVAPQIDIPPYIGPCLDLQPFQGISIGDISIGPISVPSHVTIDDPHIPSIIEITPISIPSIISITPVSFTSIPPISWADPPSIGPIEFGPVPSIGPIDISIDINIDATAIPSCISLGCDQTSIMVDWGAPPTLNVAFVAPLQTQSSRRKATFDPELAKELGSDYTALFEDDGQSTLQVEYDAVGIPSEIRIVPPEFPEIKLTHNIPSEISFTGIADIPKEIKFTGIDIPKEIIVTHEIPSEIKLIGEIPSTITIDASGIPGMIELRLLDKIPDTITIDGSSIPDSIKVVGIPDFIELRGPESIKLVLDENIEVPLVYKQGPIDVKVELDMTKLLGRDENGEGSCVMIVPCNR